MFKAELLTMVAPFALEDGRIKLKPTFDAVSGALKRSEKKLRIAMLRDSESLRQRFRTISICICYLRSPYPNTQVLESTTITRWHRYVNGLFGFEV